MENRKVFEIKPLGFPWETQDPFLFCAHHRDEYPKGNERMGVDPGMMSGRNIGQDFSLKDGWRMYHGRKVPGFPYHPHRGFETITINKEGFVDHSDSLGASGRFGQGDVQWMTAGKGLQHSEMFPLINQDKGNPLEIFQLWLNLPKASKFVEPHFRMLWKEMIPTITDTDQNGKNSTIDIIAGNLLDVQAPDSTPNSWAAKSENGVSIFTLKMEAGAEWVLPKISLENVNRTLYFYRGVDLRIDGKLVKEYHLIKVDPHADITIQNGDQESYLLILQGKPINEPVVQHGPIVMNTEEEIEDAFREYRKTQFGGWPWPETEQVFPKEKGRFASHADGREEIK